jgi:hypothetical protein
MSSAEQPLEGHTWRRYRSSTDTNFHAEPKSREALKVVGGTEVYSLINMNAAKQSAAEVAVEDDLRRHDELYQRLLGWPVESTVVETKLAELEAALETEARGNRAQERGICFALLRC